MRLRPLVACLLLSISGQDTDKEPKELGRARWKKKPKIAGQKQTIATHPSFKPTTRTTKAPTTTTRPQRNKDWNEFSIGNQQYRSVLVFQSFFIENQ